MAFLFVYRAPAALLRPSALALQAGVRVTGCQSAHLRRYRVYGPQASGQAEKQSVSADISEVKGEGLSLSDSCVKQLLRVTEDDPNALLRVVVDGGGCSGFQYKFNLDTQVNSDDKVFERGGARVVIDDLSLSLLKGSTVDYHTELIRSSFRITDNPNAELGCSCGASFALK